jgi:hypothetical protein
MDYYHSSSVFEYCVFTGNRASYGGGFFTWDNSTPHISRCSFSANSAERGGGAYCLESFPAFERTILWGNCAGSGGSDLTVEDQESSVSFTCCDVDTSGIESSIGILWNGINISTDPLFCMPEDCGIAPTAAGCYALQECSPCVSTQGCGQIGALRVGCSCGGGPSSSESTTWGQIKAEFGE